MGEVVARTGMSQRTIYRMVSGGHIRQAQRPMPGRRPMSVFDPVNVMEIAASTVKAGAPPSQSAIPRHNQPLERDSRKEIVPGSPLPPSELSFKLYLTEEEALRYTGFGREHLRVHGKGKRIGPHGSTVYRRVDLEKI